MVSSCHMVARCHSDELPGWRVVRVASCQFGQLSGWRVARLVSCQGGELKSEEL
jgi:hypothetical protein